MRFVQYLHTNALACLCSGEEWIVYIEICEVFKEGETVVFSD